MAEKNTEARWYVAHTYSGYENKVKMDLEKTIDNRGLQDVILEVSVPMQPVIEVKNGVEKKTDKKMFPGYVLVNMVMNDETWYVVRNTRGVTGFVGPGSKPVINAPIRTLIAIVAIDSLMTSCFVGKTIFLYSVSKPAIKERSPDFFSSCITLSPYATCAFCRTCNTSSLPYVQDAISSLW